jgi:hypothetical protein
MINRRGFLATAGATLISGPTVLRAQTAPTRKLRIVVVANRYHEADGLMAALTNQMRQNSNLSYPYKVASSQVPAYPPPPQNSLNPRCLIDVKKSPSDTASSATMEIWCIDDLANVQGDSKAR